jgi:DNA-binding NarL/FixJ family response regulator
MLTPKQDEVVELIGRDGCSNEAVAARMGVTVGTVKAHVFDIAFKLNSHRKPREAILEFYLTEKEPCQHPNT